MLKEKDEQLSIFSILYNKIPENHTLKILRDELDFSFINEVLQKSYSERYGRPAKEPELMVKLLLLQHLYDLSDVRVIEDSSLNLAYMYFLGINPEEELPDPSLLTKFRKDKLGSKTEYMITTNERIITAVNVDHGAYVDGKKFDELLELTKQTGLTIKKIYGDKAYFRKLILDSINETGATPFIPVSEMAYRINEDQFSYNKDADEWFCTQGNKTVRKHTKKQKIGKGIDIILKKKPVENVH